ncbi:putative laccase [Emiliania huxleyi CCMP1516]|uniref:Plastocyanin-like domain-containing protein n=2 Tax=Emiliania huxleyi TaxID=2903 RepID=A0A0D3JVD1_EMIH1|nr:putative laccase [Emiliania huxleyi CCMP1516]EOD27466.1 putative laccase [Emiliania huxleyi CCMP1516]|eukprot:XP_005779895.1 putative laccase [Emiliania huxleyi CCMP1516]
MCLFFIQDRRHARSSHSNTLVKGSKNKHIFDGMFSVDAKPPVGQPIELDLHGLYFHAFHLHVNPFQLQGDPVLADATAALPTGNSGGAFHANFEEKKTGAFADYFRAGDWHDTLMLPTRNSLTVRSQTDKFTGSQIFHCHILDHEDLGMMGQFLIQEGPDAEWAGARRIDPRCYNASSVERGGARPFARIVDPGSSTCQNYGIGRRDIPDATKRDVEIAKVEIDVEVEITTGEAIRPVAPQAPSGMAEREVV